MRALRILLSLSALLLLGACVSMPTGPSVMVLPGTSKNFDQFRADDMDCRQFASSQVNGSTPDSAAADSGVRSAVIGTVLGAAVGALVGGHNPVATGAGIGLVSGAALGSGAANQSQYDLQRRYDNGYLQCMYARGHQVPGASSGARRPATYARPVPPPPPPQGAAPQPLGAAAPPPPPPGAPPPPPPGVAN